MIYCKIVIDKLTGMNVQGDVIYSEIPLENKTDERFEYVYIEMENTNFIRYLSPITKDYIGTDVMVTEKVKNHRESKLEGNLSIGEVEKAFKDGKDVKIINFCYSVYNMDFPEIFVKKVRKLE